MYEAHAYICRVNPSRILVVGSGGREHALAWRLAADLHAPTVWVAPGNDGMEPAFDRLAIREDDASGLLAAVRTLGIDLVVFGPEAPLAAGVSDALSAAGVRVFGASQAAARLESSKWFAKEIMFAAGVPTARAEVFDDLSPALAALDEFGPNWVVKADGLAAGKGVLVTADRTLAEAFVRDCLVVGRFGAGGSRLVLEEYLEGEEASVIAVCDGARSTLLPAARDHKRAYDGDRGANTGGMGAYAPTPVITPELEQEVTERIVQPVLQTLAARGTPYRGALYCGLMLTAAGPRVIEFNARFGDPETQCILPLVTGSFSRLLASAAEGALEPDTVGRTTRAAVTVAVVEDGYPDARSVGGEIFGLDALAAAGFLVFHAGTRRAGDHYQMLGGRAAHVAAVADSIEAARVRVYDGVGTLSGQGWRVRQDIAATANGAAMRSMR